MDGEPPQLREPIVAWLQHLLFADDYERLNSSMSAAST